LQPWLFSLVEQLSALPSIEVVEIETNGSQRLDVLAASRTKKLTFTMDYKLPSSGMEGRMCTENFAVLGATDVVKFVAGSREDLETMARVVGEYNLTTRCKVYVSPVFGEIEPAEIVEFLKDRSLDQVVLQLQLHKIIWPNQEKGV
jgi:7-carboxy-7-deazaguanine synthase